MAEKYGRAIWDSVLGFIKVVVSIILAIIVLSIGMWSFEWATGINARGIIGNNPTATGIVVAGLLVAIAIILGPTIASVKIE